MGREAWCHREGRGAGRAGFLAAELPGPGRGWLGWECRLWAACLSQVDGAHCGELPRGIQSWGLAAPVVG